MVASLIVVVIWSFLIGIFTIAMVLLARIIAQRDTVKVIHMLSDNTLRWLNGKVDNNQLDHEFGKYDLSETDVYNIRVSFGFKPVFFTSYNSVKPLQITGATIEGKGLSPKEIKEMGNVESVKQIAKLKLRGRQEMFEKIVFAVMGFVMGILAGIAFFALKAG